jgi:HD superfamily phosphohydrolase
MQFRTVEDNWIKPFIDSPNFQRLRHIKQLGMGDLIFPGAVHTRFNHCLGCSYVASQISNKIGLPEDEMQLVVIACLLHDIGHGPFSHAFEDIFYHKLIRHEDWTPYFLADYRQPEFFASYNRRNPEFKLNDEKISIIQDIIMHKTSKKRVMADIVSSQLDSDRLDYLLRDNHFCGVNYGEFDFRWMLNCMTVVNSKHGERLGITYKGVGVVEHYLMARRLMMRNIYHSQKKLAMEYLLVKLLASLAETLKTYAPFADIKATRLGKFLMNVHGFNQKVKTSDSVDKHKQEFLQQNFGTYKELCDYDLFAIVKQLSAMPDEHPAVQLARRIQFRQIPSITRLDYVDIKIAEEMLHEFKAANKNVVQDWQLALIKTPHQSYTIEEDPILVVTEHGKVKPINEMSLMISAISDKFENMAFLCVDAELADDPRVLKITKKFAEGVVLQD